MRKFVIKLLTFTIPVIVLLGLCEFVARGTPNSYKYKDDWMQKNHQSVKTLILGNSHTYMGVKPEYLGDSVFNLANLGQSLYYDQYLINRFVDRCSNLKTIIIPISTCSLFDKSMEEQRQWYRCIYYKLYMGCEDHGFFSKYNYELSNPDYCFKKIDKFVRLKLGDKDYGYDAYGWCTDCEPGLLTNQEWEESKGEIEDHKRSLETLGSNVDILKDVARTCKKKNIRLVLITTPTWHTYYDDFPQNQLKEMYRGIECVEKTCNVEHYDYLKDKRFEAIDFYNCSHLSRVGAIKFSQILSQDLKL